MIEIYDRLQKTTKSQEIERFCAERGPRGDVDFVDLADRSVRGTILANTVGQKNRRV